MSRPNHLRAPAAQKRVREPRDFAVEYLNALLEDTTQEELTATLARRAQACGGARLAEKVELNGAALYRALCRHGNPDLQSAARLLRAMGIRLALQLIPDKPLARRRRSVAAHR